MFLIDARVEFGFTNIAGVFRDFLQFIAQGFVNLVGFRRGGFEID